MNKLDSLLKKKKLLVAGLLSGTSADGIDACLVKIEEAKAGLKIKPLGFKTYEYPHSIRRRIFGLYRNETGSLDDLVRLNVVLGQRFAQAFINLCRECRVSPKRVDLIGSHGQTIRHLPKSFWFCGEKTRGTLQIGEPAVIAAKSGVVTIGDFRPADMAVGGEGAPLCPLAHFHLFRSVKLCQCVVNIGGIANITVLPRKSETEKILAFDTAPGNTLIDSLMSRLYNRRYDRDGEIAFRGRVKLALLEKLKMDSYFRQRPPKSAERGQFQKMMKAILGFGRISKEDTLATASELTCWSIFHSFQRWIKPRFEIDRLVICGGGAHNRYMTNRLSALFNPIKVVSSWEVGFNPDQIEAICFAILAYLTLKGKAGNILEVTGASKKVRLGKICLP